MGVLSDNPFLKAKEIIEKIKNVVDIIIVDFHAEATAEKIAMSYYLDGEVTIILCNLVFLFIFITFSIVISIANII